MFNSIKKSHILCIHTHIERGREIEMVERVKTIDKRGVDCREIQSNNKKKKCIIHFVLICVETA